MPYQNGKLSKEATVYSNYAPSSRTFLYDAFGNPVTINYSSGGVWNLIYFTDQKRFDPSSQQLGYLVSSFQFYSSAGAPDNSVTSYTSAFTYNAAGYPSQEVQTYFNKITNNQITYDYTYE